jgi:hypothetical protein
MPKLVVEEAPETEEMEVSSSDEDSYHVMM